MTIAKPTILLFEDTDITAARLLMNLSKDASLDFNCELFSALEDDTDESFVERLVPDIRRYGEVLLIVSDMDLSKTDKYKGLTDAVIFRVAHDLGIPTAFYSTALGTPDGQQQDQAGDGRILLGSTDYVEIAHKIGVLARGFVSIKEKSRNIFSATEARPRNAAEFVSELLGRRDIHHRVGLYLSGDQRMGAEILSSPKDARPARQSSIFGTWIYDSLMRYPGVFLNTVAAASYLNISISDFGRDEVQVLLADSKYNGPFADEGNPLYWRDLLDKLLVKASVDDGLELLAAKGVDVQPCMCSVDPNVTAGFYCMITEKPVSFENSVGNISWFPPGADLARLSSPEYEELAPWLGV